MPNWKKIIVSGSDASLNTLTVLNGITGSLFGTASYALTANNSGVTKIIAGANINLSPVSGLGDVTVTSFGTNLYNTATGSYGSFFDTGSVSANSATAIYSMSLNTTDISNGVFISASNGDNTRVKFTNAGTYNVQFSSQFSNTDNSNQDVVIWIKKNGTDVPDSSGVVSVPPFKAGSNGQVISGWNYYLSLAANDFIQLCWHVEQANVITLETIVAGTSPTHPRTPSTILTAQRVDTFLSNTGSFSGSFTGILTGTASFATTASYVTGSIFTNSNSAASASFASTASYYGGSVISASFASTASYAIQALSASFAPSTPTFPFTGSAIISSSLNVIGNTTITGSLNITGSSTITNGALILSSSAGSAVILRTAGDSVYMLDNYGATGRSYLRIGTTGIAIHNAGADPTITCAIGMNINSSATIYSSATSHIFYGGTNKQVSIGTAAVPTAKLHIAAGAAAATSAPIKLTAGTNMTTPEAGAVEFDGTNLFFTTGSTRQIAVAATSALTSSRIPFATTNGRLIDSANLTYGATANTLHVEGGSGNILFELTRAGEITYKYNIDSSNTLNITTSTGDTSYYFLRGNKFGIGINATARLHVVGGTATANTAPIKLTSGTNLTTPEAGTIEFDGTNLFFTPSTVRQTILTNTNPASITGNLVVTGSLLLSGSSLVAGITPIPLAGTIKDGVTSVLGSLNDWNSNFYQGDVLYSETAGGTITFGQLCYRTQTETWALADATAIAASATNMLGICVKSSTISQPTSILINGFVETATYAAILKTGEPLYMATTAGSMTKTAPTTAGNIVRLIGHTFWDSNTNSKIIIRFNPENSWIEL